MGKNARLKAQKKAAPDAAAQFEAAQPGSRGETIAIAAALAILVAIIYAQLATHQFINLDDEIYVTKNAVVQKGLTASGIAWAFQSFLFNWHPLTWLSHMLDVQLFGMKAGAHLLVNALLHLLNTLLVFFIFRRATHRLWPSAAVAALFAVHPLHVESVAWVAERKDVLSALFFLLAVYLHVAYVQTRSKWAYAGVSVAYVLGAMSKGMVVTLPFVLLLVDFWPLRRVALDSIKGWREILVEKIPLFILLVPTLWVTFHAQHVSGAITGQERLPFVFRLSNAIISYVKYLWLTIWPGGLAIPYPYRAVMKPSDVVACAVVLVAVFGAVIYLRRFRWLVTGWLWFFGMMVPVIGLVQIGDQAMADRYMYLPSIGLFAAIVWGALELARTAGARKVVAAAAVVITLALTAVAYVQAGYWKDSSTLFGHSVAVTENNGNAHLLLGLDLMQKEAYSAALTHFDTAVANLPYSRIAHRNRGTVLVKLNRVDEALPELRAAVKLDPRIADSHAALANALLETGQNDEAIAEAREALRLQPDSADLHNDLAAALARAERNDEALREYAEALRLEPNHYDAHLNLGALMSRLGRDANAIAQFQAAAAARPGLTEPHVYLALAYAQSGKRADAAREAQSAMLIDEKKANQQLSDAIRVAPNPDNLRQFIAQMKQ